MYAVIRAVSFRLFASTANPRRTLAVRTALLLGALSGLSVLAVRTSPKDLLTGMPLSTQSVQALLTVMIICMTSAVFVLTHSFQRSALDKMRVLTILPLSHAQRLGLYMYSFLPLVLGLLALSLPAMYVVFGSYLSTTQFIYTCLISYGVTILFHICIRITDHTLQAATQLLSIVLIGGAYVLGNNVLSTLGGSTLSMKGIAAILAVQIVAILLLLRLPVGVGAERKGLPMLLTHHHLTIAGSVLARALRTARFNSAMIMVLGMIGGMIIVSYNYPARLPFDIVAVVSIVLVGTLAQEIRSLSRKYYPLEAVHYSQIYSWQRGVWTASYLNGVVFVGALLLAAHVFFAEGLSVSMPYVGSMAAVLMSMGILTSSIVVPQKNDILSQLGSTLVYGFSVWVAFKYLALFDQQTVATIVGALGAIVGCLAASYGIEKLRWIKTIRGAYGKLF